MTRPAPLPPLGRRIAALASGILIAAMAVAVIAPAMGSFPTPKPVVAAACWDTSCLGSDPQTTGCNTLTPQNVDSVWRDNPDFPYPASWTSELRYSGGCGANWGRALSGPCGSDPCHSEVWVANSLGQHYGGAWGAGTFWTPMLSGWSSVDQACGYADGQDDSDRDGDDGAVCTGWH